MEGNLLGLDFAVRHVNLVANENDGNVLADTDEVLVPLGDILICDARANIKHDDSAVSTNATRNMHLVRSLHMNCFAY